MKDESNPYDNCEDLTFTDVTTEDRLEAQRERDALIAESHAELFSED